MQESVVSMGGEFENEKFEYVLQKANCAGGAGWAGGVSDLLDFILSMGARKDKCSK